MIFFYFLETLYRLKLIRDGDIKPIMYLPIWQYDEVTKETFMNALYQYSHIGNKYPLKCVYRSMIFGSIEIRPQLFL